MGLFTRAAPPSQALAPGTYDQSYFNRLTNTLTQYFNSISAVQPINVSAMNMDLDTLPTEADLATIRAGDVYRDTVDGTLRINDSSGVTAPLANNVLLWLSL